MADQRFSAVIREAIWIAHSKRCAYTHELVDLASMHVDHIIPEHLVGKADEFAAVRATLALPADFDLFGLENLLPAKPGANLQKGDLTLTAAGAHFFLNIAASKMPAIESNIDKINRRLQSGRAFIMIQQMLESGKITPADVASLLARPAEEVFTLLERMEFADKSQVLEVSKAEIAELRTRPIKLGANDHLDGLTLGNDRGEERHVRTCVEYDEALRTGFYARNTFEIKMSVFFEHQCGLLTALAKATLPTESHIAEPRVGVPDLNLLPFSMFPDPSASVSDPPVSTETYKDKVDSGELVIKNIGSAILNVEEPKGMGQQLVEVVRADFDGDGVEDILVFEYCYATRGTLGFGGLKLLSRKSSDGPFENSTIGRS